MDALVKTALPKKNYGDGLVPAIESGALISDEKGNFKASQTLPVPVQKNIEAENLKFKDSTTNNSTETKHGFLPKLSGEEDEYLNGEGEFVKPPRSGSGFANIYKIDASQTVTIGANYENVVSNMIIDGALVVDGRLTIGI